MARRPTASDRFASPIATTENDKTPVDSERRLSDFAFDDKGDWDARRFPRWRAFRMGNPKVALCLVEHLDKVSSVGVYGCPRSTELLAAFAEKLLRSAEFMLPYTCGTFSFDGGSTIDVATMFGSPKCGKYVEFALKEATKATHTETEDGRPRDVHPAVLPCVGPLLARGGTEMEFMLYDFDGTCVLADKALLPIDRARENIMRREDAKSSFLLEMAEDEQRCIAKLATAGARQCRTIVRGSFTCAPIRSLVRVAKIFAFVPKGNGARSEEIRDATMHADEVLSRAVDGYIRQSTQPGWNVANIISSGLRGGFVGDRRKKGRAAEAGDAATNVGNDNSAIGGSSSNAAGTASSAASRRRSGQRTRRQLQQKRLNSGRMTARRRRQQQQKSAASSRPTGANYSTASGKKSSGDATTTSSSKRVSFADDDNDLLELADELAIGDQKAQMVLAACRAESENAGAVPAAIAAVRGETLAMTDPLDAVARIVPRMWTPSTALLPHSLVSNDGDAEEEEKGGIGSLSPPSAKRPRRGDQGVDRRKRAIAIRKFAVELGIDDFEDVVASECDRAPDPRRSTDSRRGIVARSLLEFDQRVVALGREIELLKAVDSDEKRKTNFWVEARSRDGSGWSRNRFPCGCTLSLLVEISSIAQRRASIDEAAAVVRGEDMAPHDPFAVSALAVDMLCGTLSKCLVEDSKTFAAALSASEDLASGLARDVSGVLVGRMKRERKRDAEKRKKDAGDDDDNCDERADDGRSSSLPFDNRTASMFVASPEAFEARANCWAAGICGHCAALVDEKKKKTNGEKMERGGSASSTTSWCFARVTRFEWTYQARNLAIATGMYGRAEEIAAAAIKTRRGMLECTDAFAVRPRVDEDDPFSIPTAALAFEPPNGWPCDVAYAVSLAADAMRIGCVSSELVGDVAPLSDSVSVVVLPRRGCACGKGTHAADGTDALVAGIMSQIMSSGVARESDCALVYPFAVLVLWCASTAQSAQERDAGRSTSPFVLGGWLRRGKTAVYPNSAEPRISGRRNGWETLLWAAVAFVSDVFDRSIVSDSPSSSSSYHHHYCPLAVDRGRLDPEDELFCEYRLLGKLLVAAMSAIETREDADAVKRGFSCVARPKSRWSIARSFAMDLLDTPQIADEMAANLRKALETAVASSDERRGDDDLATIDVPLAPSADADETAIINVALVAFAATVGGKCESNFLRSVSLFSEDATTSRQNCRGKRGSLSSFDVATLGSPVLEDVHLESGMANLHSTTSNLVDAKASKSSSGIATTSSRKRPRCSPFARPTTSECRCPRSGFDRSAEENSGEMASCELVVPELSRLMSAFAEFYDEATTCEDRSKKRALANATMRFVADAEANARCAKRKCEYAKAKWMSADDMRIECIIDWKKLRLPLAVLGCTGQVLRSDEFLPVADYPMSNRFAYPASCCGCHRTVFPRIDDEALPFFECLPYKHGPIMAEIVHAGPSGLRILRHAHPAESEVNPGGYSANQNAVREDVDESRGKYACEAVSAVLARRRRQETNRARFGCSPNAEEGDSPAKLLAAFRTRPERCPCLFNDEKWLRFRAFRTVDDVDSELSAFAREMSARDSRANLGGASFAADPKTIAAALATDGRSSLI